MVIFNSYVSLPEGTKEKKCGLKRFHEQNGRGDFVVKFCWDYDDG